jgi:hypothetical protein
LFWQGVPIAQFQAVLPGCKVNCTGVRLRRVCGSDGITYQSKCHAKQVRKCLGQNIQVKSGAACKGKRSVVCISLYISQRYQPLTMHSDISVHARTNNRSPNDCKVHIRTLQLPALRPNATRRGSPLSVVSCSPPGLTTMCPSARRTVPTPARSATRPPATAGA